MKKLTIKKVALGVALAGYAASSAFAATATTSSTIKGTAPVIVAKGVNMPAGGIGDITDEQQVLTVTLTKGTGQKDYVEQGDTITFAYNLLDADGDSATVDKGPNKNMAIYYKKNNSWVKVPEADITRTTLGEVSVKVSPTFIGATDIGYVVTAETVYGSPAVGDWLSGSVFSIDEPGKGEGSAPTEPGDGGNGNNGGETLPKLPDEGEIPAGSLKAAIFVSGSGNYDNADNNYSVTATNPKYGQKFDLVVWDDVSGNDKVDADEVASILTVGTDTGQLSGISWGYIGNDKAANGVANDGGTASVTVTEHTAFSGSIAGTGISYTLPSKNADYGITNAYAGAQGFNLSVEYTIN